MKYIEFGPEKDQVSVIGVGCTRLMGVMRTDEGMPVLTVLEREALVEGLTGLDASASSSSISFQ